MKCTHGATIGQIDQTALFYLKSRGIENGLARRLLTYAFAADVLETIEVDEVRDDPGAHVARAVRVSDTEALYQEIILEHNRKPRNFREMPDADRTIEGRNPLCGDALTLWLKFDDDRDRRRQLQGAGMRDLASLGVADDGGGQGKEPRRSRGAVRAVS